MLRKLALTLVAAASLGAAALAPTAASAHWHGGWHHGWGAPASSSAARSITAADMAAAMCDGWFPPRGAPAGAW